MLDSNKDSIERCLVPTGAPSHHSSGEGNPSQTVKALVFMLVTRRELQGVWGQVALWVMLSLAATILGPFGTYEALTPLPRFGYWSLIVAVSLILDICVRRYIAAPTLAIHLLRRAGYVLVISLFVNALNSTIFEEWNGAAWLLSAVWFVLIIALSAELFVAFLIRTTQAGSEPQAQVLDRSGETALVARLSHDKRGELLRLEAQDHYLKIVTTAGEGLVLLRMSDALNLLDDAVGVHIHRSHWVAHRALDRLERVDGKLLLRLHDGSLLPVSRSKAAKVKEMIEQN